MQERTRELRIKNEELESAVIELQETQNQLIVQEKMAALGNLVAGISHELNSPVGAVKSAADVSARGLAKIGRILASSDDDGERAAQVERTLKLLQKNGTATTEAIERLTHILDSLKTFTNLDQADFQHVDVREGIESAITLLEHQFRERISVTRDYGDVPRVYGYPSELNQVYMNVLTNAYQSIDGNGEIEISTRSDDDHVLVDIKDNGRGISPDRLQAIFEPSFSNKESRVGMGLGLALSLNIMRKHKGDLTIKSELGKGTVATISLPLTTDEST